MRRDELKTNVKFVNQALSGLHTANSMKDKHY